MGREIKFSLKTPQEGHIADTPHPEPKVGARHYHLRVESTHQDFGNEALRQQATRFGVEFEVSNDVDAEIVKELQTVFRRSQQPRAGTRRHNRSWVLVESDDGRLPASRLGVETIDKRLVAAMDSVKHADCDGSS